MNVTKISNRLTCVDCKHYDAEGQPPGIGICREPSPQVVVVPVTVQNPQTGERSVQPQPQGHFPPVHPVKTWCGKLERKILIAH